MTLTEILQNSDVAHILAGFLKKKLHGNWAVAMGENDKSVLAATIKKGHPLTFHVECQRLGRTFDVETTFRSISNNEKFKDMEAVLKHILEVDSDPTAWELENLPHSDA